MGFAHVAACRAAGCDVQSVVDPVASVRARYDRLGIPTRTSLDAETLEGASLVIISAPTATHLDLLEAVAPYDLVVLVEKPCATSVAGFERLQAIAGTARARLFVGFWRRFSPPVRRLREVLRSGTLGAPRLVLACQWDAAPPSLARAPATTTGGIALDCGVHETDTLRWLGCGSLSTLVRHAPVGFPGWVPPGDSDQLVATGVTNRGVVASIALSRTSGADQIRLKVIGEHGSADVDLAEVSTLRVTCDGKQAEETFDREPIADALVRQVQGVTDGDPSAATADDALAAALPWLDDPARASAVTG
jgi:myo-inositol 2-dehydrogenase/D-chiro-inositol 1-dehydrogenase